MSGYTGVHCEKNIDECQGIECQVSEATFAKCPYSQSRLCFAYLTKRTKLFSRLCVQSSIKVNRNTALITLKGNENKFASINLNLESQAKTKSSDRFNENGGFGPWTRAQCMRLSEDPSKE